MRKLTLLFAALTLLGAGYLLAQVSSTTTGSKVTVLTPAGATQEVSLSADPSGINDNLAIRIEGVRDGRVVGKLVAKVEGKWVEVQLGSTNMRLGN